MASVSQTSRFEWILPPAVAIKAGLPREKLMGPFGIDHCTSWPADHKVWEFSVRPRVDLFAHSPEVVWENGECQVLLVTENDCVHLVFRPKGDASFEKLSNERFLALRNKMKVIPDVFERVFGYPDYCEQLIESSGAFGYEIFPAFEGAPHVVDLLEKDRRNLYLLTKGSHYSFSLPKDRLKDLKSELVNGLDSGDCLIQRSFLRSRTESNMPRSLAFRVSALVKLLQEPGYELLPGRSESPQASEEARLHVTKRCLFTNPPDNELLFKNDLVQVILNPKPYVGWNETDSRHVLVVPARHIEDCTSVRDDEFLAERQAIVNLRAIWKKRCPDHDFFIWKQQGIKAGQTVPHLHTQVLCAKASEIWEYYRLMIQDITSQNPDKVFAPCPGLRQDLKNAPWKV